MMDKNIRASWLYMATLIIGNRNWNYIIISENEEIN